MESSSSRHFFQLWAVVMILVGASIRFNSEAIAYVSGDYAGFLRPWMESITAKGGIYSLNERITDQSIAYTTLLTFITYLPFGTLYSVKYLSITFDFGLAIVNYLIVVEYFKNSVWSRFKGTLAGIFTLFVPTIFFNSSVWGQCDSIYSFFVMISILNLLRNNGKWAVIFFAAALSFKLQAVFFLPVLIYRWLSKTDIESRHFLAIPLVFLLSCTPALIAGRPIGDIFSIYSQQTGLYPSMTLNFASLYSVFPNDKFRIFGYWSIALCGMMLGLIMTIGLKSSAIIHREILIDVSLWVIMLVVFLLPSMHERYMYMADVLSVCYIVIRPSRWYIGVGAFSISTLCYFPFLFGISTVDLRILSLGLFINIVLLGRTIFNDLMAIPQSQAGALSN